MPRKGKYMNTLSIILIAMLGFLFALIVWAIIGHDQGKPSD